MRKLSYVQAMNEALRQSLAGDERVMLIGQGVTSPWYVGNTTIGLLDEFGLERVIDTPVSESGVTGAAVGAALAGMRPVVVHPRMDFMYYAFDQIANHAANWHYMFGGHSSVPLVIWGIINRGGEQAAQHAQALHAMLAHVPGLKVVMPSTPYDAKGLMMAAIEDNNPVVFIDERWLYEVKGEVPEEPYTVPIGKGVTRIEGSDVTLAATSYMVVEAAKAATKLQSEGIKAELLDLRSVKPLDEELLLNSVAKTGRLVIADGGWKTCGFGAEIAVRVAESDVISKLRSPIIRVTLPDAPAPASSVLEKAYYPAADDIVRAVNTMIRK
jgi:acetoin:2,6-dichlorophenolindophenol oxidoreductase subunit beta